MPLTSPIAVPHHFSSSGPEFSPGKWWLSFADDRLNKLIEEATRSNLTLKEAWFRLEQAKAIAAKSGADLLPDLTGTAAIGRSVSKNKGLPRNTFSTYSLGLAASYELDLWGRIKTSVEAAKTDVLASREDFQAAAITLSAEIATVWFQLKEQEQQLDLLDKQINTNEQYLDLVTHTFRKGQAPATDVLQQRQILESSRGEKINAASAKRLLLNKLALLLGRDPQTFTIDIGKNFGDLPPLPQTGLPAELIQSRPDIRRAEYVVRAADQRLASAVADRFPRISLSANTETSGSKASDLFDNWLANLAANLVAPLIDGGRRRAEVNRTKAVYAEALHSYGRTILTALREVEDALTQEIQQRQFLESIDKQIVLSEQSVAQIRQRYIHGDLDFLRFLSALLNHQSLQRTQIKSRRELIEYRINLYRALAGGWEIEGLRAEG
ncbi:MAG: TolC family protein [Desulfobulbaceae bacterium]|nr:TolC family protein [Desulfobulbaceae bacterium]